MKRLAARLKSFRLGETVVRRNPLYYPRALSLFDRLEKLDLEGRQRWTQVKLRTFLRNASRTRYGRRVGGGEDLSSWPILGKDAIRKDPGAFMVMPTWATSPAATSGTTGLPLKLWRSFSSVSVEQAAIDRLLMRHHVNPSDYRSAILRGDDIKDPADRDPPFWKMAGGGRRLVFSSNHLTSITLPHFLEALWRHRPQVLHAYPSILESFCALLVQADVRMTIPVTICSSEVLSGATWDLATDRLGTRVIDYYGQAERVSFAYALQKSTYRFLPGYSLNELRPAGMDDIGERFELVSTGLWNSAMPLVRLATGDLIRVEVGSEVTRIVYGLDTFSEVLGRCGDYLISPDGARLMGIDHIPRGVQNVVRMQVIQESPDFVRLATIPAVGFSDADREAILRNAALKLPPPMRFEIELVDELQRTKAGKAPFVIRRV